MRGWGNKGFYTENFQSNSASCTFFFLNERGILSGRFGWGGNHIVLAEKDQFSKFDMIFNEFKQFCFHNSNINQVFISVGKFCFSFKKVL